MTDPWERVLALHQPVTEEAESWPWNNDDHDELWPDCPAGDDCVGHVHPLTVCDECGYTHDDGDGALYRVWPCPTVRIAREVLGDG